MLIQIHSATLFLFSAQARNSIAHLKSYVKRNFSMNFGLTNISIVCTM